MSEWDDERFDALERERGYVRAWLRLTATEVGGRRTPIASGYRPQWDLGYRTDDGEISYFDAQVRLVGVRSLAPGGEAEVRLHPLSAEYWDVVRVGSVPPLYEVSRRLGEARVVEIVAPERTPTRDPFRVKVSAAQVFASTLSDLTASHLRTCSCPRARPAWLGLP